MRLSQFQITSIKSLAKKYFGPNTAVSLFGSRTDDSKKGGDIDLFIKNKDESLLTLERKIHFLAELKAKIGEQKIDVVFDNAHTRQKKNFYHSLTRHKIEI
ncbi:nucleotidyltransferase domain-containing protein [uncultured Draconibacterium sp.]|uniref:nucleotidyltransferase domain-containing protein n=1 Tax=uncultured Draconibacterium sp. TaxID=1573823 RepID=UPI0025FCDC8B|nr:nucleotidyltransferase domain-containing protein [uncultured Draconibacterium sp.]